MSFKNFSDHVKRLIQQFPLEFDTYYGKAMQLIRNYYFKNQGREHSTPVTSDVPIYVMFVTDGATSDQKVSERQLIASSYEPIFWQFMAIGSGNYSFLEKLDLLQGRYLDNANFFSVSDPDKVSEDEIYNLLMKEYPNWVKQAKSVGLLR